MRPTLALLIMLPLAGAFSLRTLPPRHGHATIARIGMQADDAPEAEAEATPAADEAPLPKVAEILGSDVAAPEGEFGSGGTSNMVEGLDYGEYSNPFTSYKPEDKREDMGLVKEALAKRQAYFAEASKDKVKQDFEPESGAIGVLAGLVAAGVAATYIFTPTAFGM